MGVYGDLGWRTPAVIGTVAVHMLCSVAASVAMWMYPEPVIEADPMAALVLLGAGIASIGTYVIAIIAVCLWTHRACANAHVLGAPDVVPTTTPAWAVGSYFVPFVNLYQPFKAVREIESATRGEMVIGGIAPWWWGTWLLGNLLANASFRLESDELGMVSALVHCASATLLGLLVSQIHQRQTERERELRLAQTPEVSTYRQAPGPGIPG